MPSFWSWFATPSAGRSSSALRTMQYEANELEYHTGHRFFGPAPQLNRPPPPSLFFLPPPPRPVASFVSRATVSASASRSFSSAAVLALTHHVQTDATRPRREIVRDVLAPACYVLQSDALWCMCGTRCSKSHFSCSTSASSWTTLTDAT